MVLFCSPPPRTRLERLAQQRFGFGLHLSEQDEAVFVEFLAARLGLDGGDAVLDFAEVVDDLPDAQGSRLVDYMYALVRQRSEVVIEHGCAQRCSSAFCAGDLRPSAMAACGRLMCCIRALGRPGPER